MDIFYFFFVYVSLNLELNMVCMLEWNLRKCGKDFWDNYLDLKKIYIGVKVEVFIKSYFILFFYMYIEF